MTYWRARTEAVEQSKKKAWHDSIFETCDAELWSVVFWCGHGNGSFVGPGDSGLNLKTTLASLHSSLLTHSPCQTHQTSRLSVP
jgi:hypothetical protein